MYKGKYWSTSTYFFEYFAYRSLPPLQCAREFVLNNLEFVFYFCVLFNAMNIQLFYRHIHLSWLRNRAILILAHRGKDMMAGYIVLTRIYHQLPSLQLPLMLLLASMCLCETVGAFCPKSAKHERAHMHTHTSVSAGHNTRHFQEKGSKSGLRVDAYTHVTLGPNQSAHVRVLWIKPYKLCVQIDEPKHTRTKNVDGRFETKPRLFPSPLSRSTQSPLPEHCPRYLNIKLNMKFC